MPLSYRPKFLPETSGARVRRRLGLQPAPAWTLWLQGVLLVSAILLGGVVEVTLTKPPAPQARTSASLQP